MGWLTKLYGTTICIDTAPLIYFVEEHPAYLPIVDPFFEAPLPPKLSVSTPNSPKPPLAKQDSATVEEDEWNRINRLLSELLDLEDEAKAAEVSEHVHSLPFITFHFSLFPLFELSKIAMILLMICLTMWMESSCPED